MKTTTETEIQRLIIKQSPRMCGCGYKRDIIFAYHAERIAAERNAAIAERDALVEALHKIADLCQMTMMSFETQSFRATDIAINAIRSITNQPK